MKQFLLAALAVLFFTGCHKNDTQQQQQQSLLNGSRTTNTYNSETVRNYFNLMCRVSKNTPGFFPTQVARAYGYVGVTAYESVVYGIPNAKSLAGQLNGLSPGDLPKPEANVAYNWAIVSNTALSDMLRKMFESTSTANMASIDSLEHAQLSALSAGEAGAVVIRSVEYGKALSAAIYKYSLTDGGDKSYNDPFQLPYNPPADAACWVPTGATLHPVSPYWGNNRPFVQANVSNTQNFGPCSFGTTSSCVFYGQAKQVYDQVANNTAEQVEIAKYWADDPFNTCTPTGHTFNILTQLLQDENATLEKSSVAYARLSIAENDAFIACWKQKFKYTLVRPVTYIKQNIDANFNTVIGTPPFPAFLSGHSAEIGAGTKVFDDMFTDGSGSYNFTDYSQLQYGFPARTYSNFNDLAQECANSRFYAGIHYPMDNEAGLQQGRMVGDNVNHMLVWPVNIK